MLTPRSRSTRTQALYVSRVAAVSRFRCLAVCPQRSSSFRRPRLVAACAPSPSLEWSAGLCASFCMPWNRAGQDFRGCLALGRPTHFRPEYSQIAAEFRRRGYSDVRLAHLLRVGPATLVGWKRDHPEFAQALAPGTASSRPVSPCASRSARDLGGGPKEGPRSRNAAGRKRTRLAQRRE